MAGRASDSRAHLSEVPGGHRYYTVLRWAADPHHVVASRRSGTALVIVAVDVRTGVEQRLTWTGTQPPGGDGFGVALASDALEHPVTVAAVEPPHPWNPRWLAGGVLAGVVLVVCGLLLVRMRSRRVRR